MSKQKRNRKQRRDPLAAANAGVREAEELLLERRLAAARLAGLANKAAASPQEQAEEFFNRPGDFYIAQFEISVPTPQYMGRDADLDEPVGPIRAQCALKADESQRDYLVEVLRQIRGAFGEGARISLSRAQTRQQRVVDHESPPQYVPQPGMAGPDLAHVKQAARAAVARRRNGQRGEQSAEDMAPDVPWRPGLGGENGSPWPGPTSEADRLLFNKKGGEIQPEVCRAHLDPDCRRCDDAIDDLWAHPRDLTREQLQAQLPGMTRAQVADELGIDPADIGGEFKHADTIELETLAAELGVSPDDLQPIDMIGGGRAYAVKPRPAPPAGRHTRPESEGDT